MQTAKLAIDPLWLCLCPSWTSATLTRGLSTPLARRKRPALRCPQELAQQRTYIHTPASSSDPGRQNGAQTTGPRISYVNRSALARRDTVGLRPNTSSRIRKAEQEETQDYSGESTPYLYTRMRALAIDGKTKACRTVAELLIQDRKEKPNVQLYSSLILSNVSHDHGAAWRVSEYLEEMRQAGLQPDTGTCHSVLKVLGVHPDHLLRADVLDYMKTRWYQLSEDGAHDVAAGLLREGLFEQGLQRIDEMRQGGIQVQGWLLDMAVYMLSTAGEVEEAYRIMRLRYDAGEVGLNRTVWHTLLDAGSSSRHCPSTSLIWNSQVNTGYLNPASGTCLNVLTTASQAGDAVLATDVFTHLSKRGTAFQPIHYQQLLECYLSTSTPDLKRALSILTIMAVEKIKISLAETRALYVHLRSQPPLVAEALIHLRELHDKGRKIPVAALNLLIECHVEQRDLAEAMKVYKLIHTFVPIAEGAKKSFANIDTFNLLLRGCRFVSPPDEGLASFLISELLALRVKPTALTYDRLILVFLQAGDYAIESAASMTDTTEAQAQRDKGLRLLDWAFRHFTDMQAVSISTAPPADVSNHPSNDALSNTATLGWMPRFGTVERLATQLAQVGDSRCWDVLQSGEDHGQAVEGWNAKGKWARKNVEEAWSKATGVAEEGSGRKVADSGESQAADALSHMYA